LGLRVFIFSILKRKILYLHPSKLKLSPSWFINTALVLLGGTPDNKIFPVNENL